MIYNEMMDMKVFYHADDFGITLEQSETILSCFLHGRLNSLSIILNSTATKSSYEIIDQYVQAGSLRCVAHLNFVEGKSMTADPLRDVPHLVDEKGNFSCKFSSLLLRSIGRQRNVIKEELKKEIRLQLEFFADLTGSRTVSIDSHRHFHMIPVVWDALCEVLDNEDYRVEYIRIPVDSIRPIRKCGKIFRVQLINYIKWVVLNGLKSYVENHWIDGAQAPSFFGILFTGMMTKEIVDSMIDKYEEVAADQGKYLELMFHPGAVKDAGFVRDINKKEFVKFYSSPYRELEREALTL